MELYSVFDAAFRPYGQIHEGFPTDTLLAALAETPVTDGVVYIAEAPVLQRLEVAGTVSAALYGGMPVQLGWCNGHNTKLNCLEYHRDSEMNLGTRDFILLLAKQTDIEAGRLDTARVRAFLVPAGVMTEIYATTLHYAPCQTCDAGFQVLVALPRGTNGEIPADTGGCSRDGGLLWARNKWLLAHPESAEAAAGAYIGLSGENLDVSCLLDSYKRR